MTNKNLTQTIRSVEDLRREKQRLHREADLTLSEIKNSINLIKKDGQRLAVNKIVVPGAAVGLSYLGLHKLMNNFKDSKSESTDQLEANASPNKPGFLKSLLKYLPFLITTGKQMYDDGQLSFLFGEEEE